VMEYPHALTISEGCLKTICSLNRVLLPTMATHAYADSPKESFLIVVNQPLHRMSLNRCAFLSFELAYHQEPFSSSRGRVSKLLKRVKMKLQHSALDCLIANWKGNSENYTKEWSFSIDSRQAFDESIVRS
jgi:hypothetical protein